MGNGGWGEFFRSPFSIFNSAKKKDFIKKKFSDQKNWNLLNEDVINRIKLEILCG